MAVEDRLGAGVPRLPAGATSAGVAAGQDPSSGSGPRRRRRWLAVTGGLALAALVVIALTFGGGLGGTAGQSQPPTAASGFSLPALGNSGGRVSLAAYAGRPVLINFFASWCGPCKRETPLLARFYREHHGRVLIIGIDSMDETAAALRFTRAAGLSYPVGVDLNGAAAASYGIMALPQTFILNARHQIVRHIVGAVTPGELSASARSLASGNS
ncbi:MAG: TlpA family protein disulfide reductase [Streptosporangiaceae bacterium]